MLPAQLRRELEQNLNEVRKQMEVVKNKASEMGVPVEELQTRDGHYPMIQLMIIKSNILNALAVLNAK